MSYFPPIIQIGTTRPVFNLLDYGADPTGVMDSTTAIQNTINAVPAGGGKIYAPPGIYKVSLSLNLQNMNGLVIEGAGSGINPGAGTLAATEFRWNGAASGTMWDCRGATFCTFRDFACNPNAIATVTGFLFDGNPSFHACRHCRFDNVTMGSATSGFGICVKLGVTASTAVSEFTFINCKFYLYTVYGVQINAANVLNHTFIGCEFDGENDAGTETGLEITNGSFDAYGCLFIKNNLDIHIGTTGQACVVSGFDAEQSNQFLSVDSNCAGPLSIEHGNVSCTGAGAGANAIVISALLAGKGPIALRQLIIPNGKNISVAVGYNASLWAEDINFVGGGAFVTGSFSGQMAGGLKVQNSLGGNFSIVNPGAGGVLTLDGADASSSIWIRPDGASAYKFGKTQVTTFGGINTLGKGLAAIVGLDNRSGVTAADGSPITLYAVPAGANQLFRGNIEIDAFAFTSGTATYTLTWTENGVAQTAAVTATALNVVTGIVRLVVPDASTNITVQLTGVFTATVRLSTTVEQMA